MQVLSQTIDTEHFDLKMLISSQWRFCLKKLSVVERVFQHLLPGFSKVIKL